MNEKRYQVFISSTFRDLAEERHQIMSVLLEMNCIPAGMELFPAANEEVWRLICRTIDQSDYYLLVIGGKYGSTDKHGISYTEREYDYALSTKKCILPFLPLDPSAIPAGKTELHDETRDRLQVFTDKVKTKHHCKFWKSPEDLGSKVTRALMTAIQIEPAVGWVRADQIKTVEDVEERRRLDLEVHSLREQLSSLSKAQEDFTNQYSQGNDITVTTYKVDDNNRRSRSISWDEIFKTVGRAMLRDPSYRNTKESLGRLLWMLDYPDSDRNAYYTLESETMEPIEHQLIALGYIVVNTDYEQPVADKNSITFGHSARGRFVKSWKLTELGYRKLAELVAVRRNASST